MSQPIPSDLSYTEDHEWARPEGDGLLRVGITSHAVEQLGDVTLVDLASPGTVVEARGHLGDIESVKTVSELFSPAAGEVVEVNAALEESPELVNEAPYEAGWMVVLKLRTPGPVEGLMDAAAYEAYLGRLEE